MGQGSFGYVVKAKHRTTVKVYAIKMIKDIFHNSYEAKKIAREMQIMRHLSKEKYNIFTVKLRDVIIPPLEIDECEKEERADSDEKKPSMLSYGELLFNKIFLVMDYFESDLQ